jgi:uncharacterized protein
MVAIVKCPVCSKPVAWNESSRWRPFCSERCRTIDLGEWAANRHVIPGSAAETAEDAPTRDGSEPPG